MAPLLTPAWLIRIAVGTVWLYEGLWCKLLGREPRQLQVVEAVPYVGPRAGVPFLKLLGTFEVALALWAFSGVAPIPCAALQTLLLVTLNVNGLIWARRIIHDPGGMVVKNFAFLVLVWVSASLPGWR
jgi:DoxX-like family